MQETQEIRVQFPGGGHGNPFQYSCLENLHGQRSLAGYSPWGHKELDRTEQLSRTEHTQTVYVVNLRNTVKWSGRINNCRIIVAFGFERAVIKGNKNLKE